MKISLKHTGEIKLPLLLLHGDQDGITSHVATQKFANQVSGDVYLKLWEGGYHELHNDPDKLEFMEYIYQWILKKL